MGLGGLSDRSTGALAKTRSPSISSCKSGSQQSLPRRTRQGDRSRLFSRKIKNCGNFLKTFQNILFPQNSPKKISPLPDSSIASRRNRQRTTVHQPAQGTQQQFTCTSIAVPVPPAPKHPRMQDLHQRLGLELVTAMVAAVRPRLFNSTAHLLQLKSTGGVNGC